VSALGELNSILECECYSDPSLNHQGFNFHQIIGGVIVSSFRADLNVAGDILESGFLVSYDLHQRLFRELTKLISSDLNYAGIPNEARVSNAILNGLSKGLILHPIAAGITFIALLFALSTHIIVDVLAAFVTFLAFLTTLIVFIFDIVLFVTARHRINDSLPGSPARLGNAFWMVMAAMIAQFLAMFLVCFGGFKRRRERRYNNDAPPMRQQW
jgi:hypothetical protein